jgi:nucleotide-binding universal stress UspA family protein
MRTSFIKNILWASDFSDEAREALLYAGFFAKAFHSRISACHVMPGFAPSLYEVDIVRPELQRRQEAAREEARSKLLAVAKKMRIPFSEVIVAEGSPAKIIIDIAVRKKADLIVIGKKGQSALEKLFIGSVANQVLRSSPLPVLVTRMKTGQPRMKKILVPTDFSAQEETERDVAWSLARGFNAAITLLHVVELFGHEFSPGEIEQMFKSLLERLKKRKERDERGLKISEEIIRAVTASHGIVDYAQANQFDLIVMSTYVQSKVERFFLGSTSEKVVSHSNVPVFAIPPSFRVK